MITFISQFEPLAAILLGALLYAVYYGVLRLKTSSVTAQAYIAVAVTVVSVFTFVTPARIIERPVLAQSAVQTPVAITKQNKLLTTITTATTPKPGEASQPTDISGNTTQALPDSRLLLSNTSVVAVPYAAGVVVMLAYFLAQLIWYVHERRRGQLISADAEARVYATDFTQPFSFGRSIFLPSGLSGELRKYALIHELCHIRRRHFLKLCLLELLLAVNWFNPFVWLFFGELKLQQELEVDADVLKQGIDRRRYQLGLLQMTVQQSRWLLVKSAFGAKPIKQRIIFMNQTFDTQRMRRRLVAAAALMLFILTAVVTASCQMNKKEKTADCPDSRHHAIYGVWQMDFTRPADSDEEIYPPFKQYAFYSDDVFFTPHLSQREGHNFFFGYSGEGLAMKGDTLVGGRGLPIIYRFVDEDTFQSDWTKESGDLSLANGKVNTDQWSRATPDADFLAVFHSACNAVPNAQRPMDGTWQTDSLDNGYEQYLFVNDTLALMLSFKCTPDPSVYRFGGSGFGCNFQTVSDSVISIMGDEAKVSWAADHQSFSLTSDERWRTNNHFHRIETPPHISRMLRATLIKNP